MSGTYKIEELTSPDGYLLNQDGVVFRIDEIVQLLRMMNMVNI